MMTRLWKAIWKASWPQSGPGSTTTAPHGLTLALPSSRVMKNWPSLPGRAGHDPSRSQAARSHPPQAKSRQGAGWHAPGKGNHPDHGQAHGRDQLPAQDGQGAVMAVRIQSHTRPANDRAKAAEPGKRTRDKKLARLG